jgi:hypothetical protein
MPPAVVKDNRSAQDRLGKGRSTSFLSSNTEPSLYWHHVTFRRLQLTVL